MSSLKITLKTRPIVCLDANNSISKIPYAYPHSRVPIASKTKVWIIMGLGKYFFNPNDAGADSTEHLLNNSFSMKMDAG